MILQDRTLPKCIAASFFALLVFSCNKNPKEAEAPEQELADSINKENKDVIKELKPTGPAPAWGPNITDEMAVVIEKLGSLGGKPIETLTAAEARTQPTPADAVKMVAVDSGMDIPTPLCDTIGKDIPVTGGKTHVRIYTPKGGAAPYPVVVYYHGGGFVIANIETYNGGAQGLCELSNTIVVSVEYPKGPEKKFPAAHTTAFDAYKWVLANAASFNGDPKKVAVAGESAGGNLACNVSMMARDKKVQLPLYQVLVYPVANNDMNSESYVKYAAAKPLNKPMMAWFVKNALPSEATAADPRVSLVKANLAGLPQTLIIGAEIDPLATEGKLLSDKLKDAKVDTSYELYKGVTHEFFGMALVVPEAKKAQELAAKKLKSAFGM
ncbi:MAG: alpha/beta hydrolase [Flavobacterium sp.]|uniref:alpha/beta hydrolase n=1 Tax=Flavobacterium sp. TaxID=239 RepID=UPI001212727C|nr:alpha/beta hydrolase [Flavobacterium sp.]RZJ68333.1 MAG: alpha/beta hydrolase [Flavobacterium sp.]